MHIARLGTKQYAGTRIKACKRNSMIVYVATGARKLTIYSAEKLGHPKDLVEALRSLASPILDEELCLKVHPRDSGRHHWVYCDKRMVARSGFAMDKLHTPMTVSDRSSYTRQIWRSSRILEL